MMQSTKCWMMGLVACAVFASNARDADACGGVFSPPRAAQLVTDNSIVMSISAAQTTLWTQPRYAGRATEFSWVFPLRYSESTRFALASDTFIPVTERLTAPTLTAPTPVVTTCVNTIDGGGFNDGGLRGDGGVIVQVMTTLGPYELAVLRGSDPMALRTWLQANGYVVPTTIDPVLGYYIGQSMDFVALRLRPGEGADRLPPIRITMPGALMRVPLRMIAAGAADHVRLRLVIFSASRIEAMNFPNGEFTDTDFVWDWSQPPDSSAAITAAFQRLNARSGGRLWVTEAARMRYGSEWSYALEDARRGLPDAGVGDGGTPDAGPVQRAEASDDLALAFGASSNMAYVTRLYADLTVPLLDRDLDLAASAAAERWEIYRYGTELHRPAAPDCRPPAPSGGFECRAAPNQEPAARIPVAALFAFAVGAALSRRRAGTR